MLKTRSYLPFVLIAIACSASCVRSPQAKRDSFMRAGAKLMQEEGLRESNSGISEGR